MKEVMFEWADGPNANAAFEKLYVFSKEGEKIKPRMQEKKYHKNGKWSYSDMYVFVPEEAFVLQSSGNTHGNQTKVLWIAREKRPVVFRCWGRWVSLKTWPTPEDDIVSPEMLQKILKQIVPSDVQAIWDANESAQSI